MEKQRKRNIKPEYAQFQDLMEKHFLENVNISKEVINNFNDALKKANVSQDDIRDRYDFFISRNYMSRRDSDTGKPLYIDRNYALKIHSHVFYELFNTANALRMTNKHLIMSLCGILDFPADIFGELDKISNNRQPVLITGETGTGKELYAKAIHYLSPCRKKEFLPINCSGIPDSLLESELFGHEKGAFTGANKRKIGLLEKVGDGTLFFDEIADMSMNLQAKLLRVLQDRDFRRIGGTDTLYFNGRVIAATNRDLRDEIRKGNPNFRRDLFYRLNVLNLKLPSLREMPDDKKRIVILMMHERIKAELNFTTSDAILLSEDVLDCLMKYDYPGNFRELSNVLTRALILSEGRPIEMKLLPDEVINYKLVGSEDAFLPQRRESLKNVKLVNVLSYAELVKASIVREKIKDIYREGTNMKDVIREEMGKDYSETKYQTIRNKIVGTAGPLKSIRIKSERNRAKES